MRMVPRKHFECSNCFSPTATLNWMSRRKWMSTKSAKSRKFSYWFFPPSMSYLKWKMRTCSRIWRRKKKFIFLCFVAAVDWGAPQPWEVSGVVGVPTGHMKEEEPEEGFSWKAVTGPIPAETSKGWLEEGEPGASSFHSVFQLTKETRVTAPT